MKHSDFLLKVLLLGVGLAISFVLLGKVCFEMTFDRIYKDAERICQLRTHCARNDGTEGSFWNVSGAIAPGVMRYAPGVEAATRTTGLFSSDKYLTEDKRVVSGDLLLADTMFFSIFDRPILVGDPVRVLSERGKVMVSRSFAAKICPVEEIVGRTITNEEMPQLVMTVGGVFEDFPENASMKTDILLSMETYSRKSTQNWLGNDRYMGFVKLAEGVDAESLYPAIRLMQEKYQDIEEVEASGTRISYRLVPITRAHWNYTSARSTVMILSFVTFLLLGISILNYVLLAVSAIVRRSKEMAVRKCYGAVTGNIYALLFRETAVVLAVALGFAGLTVWTARPLIYELVGVELKVLLVPELYLTLGVMTVLVFLCSAVLPGMLYARVPVNVIISRLSMNRRRWKLSLLFLQFVICVMMTVFMLMAVGQYHASLTRDPGYSYKQTLVVSRGGLTLEQFRSLEEPLRGMAEVKAVAVCDGLAFRGFSGNNVCSPDRSKELFNIADQYQVSPEYYDLMGVRLLEGRYPNNGEECVVTRSFVEKVKTTGYWKEGLVGQTIPITEHGMVTVVGVYEDYLLGTADSPDLRPSALFGCSETEADYFSRNLLIRLHEMTPEAVTAVGQKIDEVLHGARFDMNSWSEMMEERYGRQRQMRNTIMVGAFFTMLVALFGLISYIRDESQRRTKEIALRKINGATVRELMLMLVGDTLRLFLGAMVVADLVVVLVGSLWLEQFSVRTALHVWYFAAGDVAVMAVVVGVVLLNIRRTVNANPVESLKSE